LFGFIDAYSTTVTVATEMSSWVECTNDAAPATEIGYHGEAAKNYTPGDTYLSPATLFTAPAAGTFTCSLMAYAGDYVPDQVLPPTGIYVNGGDTSLGWDSADVGSAGYWNSSWCADNYAWQHLTWPACTYLGNQRDGTPGISQTYVLDAAGTDPAQ